MASVATAGPGLYRGHRPNRRRDPRNRHCLAQRQRRAAGRHRIRPRRQDEPRLRLRQSAGAALAGQFRFRQSPRAAGRAAAMAAAGRGRRIVEMLGQRRRRPLGPRRSTGATGTDPGKRSRFTPGKPAIARIRDNAARHIRLRSLQVRELSGLTAAAAADLLAKAAAAGVAMKTDQGESPQAWTSASPAWPPRALRPRPGAMPARSRHWPLPVQTDAAESLLYRAVRERSERTSLDAGQDRSVARCGPRLAVPPGRLPAAVGALGPAWPRSAQRRQRGPISSFTSRPSCRLPSAIRPNAAARSPGSLPAMP